MFKNHISTSGWRPRTGRAWGETLGQAYWSVGLNRKSSSSPGLVWFPLATSAGDGDGLPSSAAGSCYGRSPELGHVTTAARPDLRQWITERTVAAFLFLQQLVSTSSCHYERGLHRHWCHNHHRRRDHGQWRPWQQWSLCWHWLWSLEALMKVFFWKCLSKCKAVIYVYLFQFA